MNYEEMKQKEAEQNGASKDISDVNKQDGIKTVSIQINARNIAFSILSALFVVVISFGIGYSAGGNGAGDQPVQLVSKSTSTPASTYAKSTFTPKTTASSNSTPTPTFTPTPTPTPSKTTYKSGQYKVGVDIPAGEYFLLVEKVGSPGYFCVSKDANDDDIIFNDNFNTNSIITIKDGQYLNLSRCQAIPFGEIQQDIYADDEILYEGMYKVGYHIPAGEYKLTATSDSGYYCLYTDSTHDKIISNDNFSGSRYVKISAGQYLVLNRCTLALK